MADLNKPTVDSDYHHFPDEIKAALTAALSFMAGEHQNIPKEAKRWNSKTFIFERYNGSKWEPMSTRYLIPVSYTSLIDKPIVSSDVNSDSTTNLANSKAVKKAYEQGIESMSRANIAQKTANDGVSKANTAKDIANDAVKRADNAQTKANQADDNANGRVSKSGDRMTGDLEIKSGQWSSIKLFNSDNHYLRIEVSPNSDASFGALLHHDGNEILHRLLMPKKTGTLATIDDIKTTYRKDYSRTIKGTSTWDRGISKSIQLDGSVTVYPDGRIVQVLHLKNFRIFWFQVEELYGLNGSRHPLISLPLWTTMPTKILSVTPQLVQATTAGNTPSYVGEAGEWISAWALRKQGNDKNNIYVNTRRFEGDGDEAVDLYVVVEGY